MKKLIKGWGFIFILFIACVPLAFAQDKSDFEEFPQLEGEGLTVVRKARVTEDVKMISKKEIVELNPQDLNALLEKGLGVSIIRNGGYGSVSTPSLRGFGSGRVAILINGVPVNSAQSGSFDLSSIGVHSIEKIEVSSGGTDSRFSSSGAIGGTINIVTVPKIKHPLEFSCGISNTTQIPAGKIVDFVDTQNINFSVMKKTDTIGFSVSWFANNAGNHYRYTDRLNRSLRLENSEVQDTGLSTSISYAFSEHTKVLFSGTAYSGNKNVAGMINSASPGKQDDVSIQNSLFVESYGFLTEELTAEFSLSHSFSRNEWESAADTSRHDSTSISAVNRWLWFFSPSLIVNAGEELRWNALNSTNLGNNIHSIDGAFWAGAEIYPFSSLLISPSFRLVITKVHTVPVPKIGLAWFTPQNLTLKTNVFRVYKNPDFNSLYWTADAFAEGNPDLKPEQGYGADLIIEKEIRDVVSLETSFFTARHMDAIIWNPEGSIWKPMNVGEALYAGVDARAKMRLPFSFSASLSYSFLQTWLLSNKQTFSDNRRMPYTPLHKGSTSLSWKTKNTSVQVSSQYIGERFTATDNLTRLPGILTFDASISQALPSGFNVYIEGKNVGNAEVVLIDGYPLPRMTVTLGARYRYR